MNLYSSFINITVVKNVKHKPMIIITSINDSIRTFKIFSHTLQTMCLHRAFVPGQVGGRTPGKRFMGLKVISCAEVVDTGANTVHVTPAEDLGFWK